MPSTARTTLVFGAAGLIGQYLVADLRRRGFRAVGVARRFPTRPQADDVELPIMAMSAQQLAELFRSRQADVIVNCLGVLQDGPGSDVSDVHVAFVERLIALSGCQPRIRLIHVSVRVATKMTAAVQPQTRGQRLIRASGSASSSGRASSLRPRHSAAAR